MSQITDEEPRWSRSPAAARAEKLRPESGSRILAAMGKDITLSGFFLTADEWESMDPTTRAQMLSAALRRDELWPAAAPPDVEPDADDYAAYEVVWAA